MFLSCFSFIKGSKIVTNLKDWCKLYKSLAFRKTPILGKNKIRQITENWLKLAKIQRGDPCMKKKIFFHLHSQIWFRVGLNDHKSSAYYSKNICINVLCDMCCHYMTSHDIQISSSSTIFFRLRLK